MQDLITTLTAFWTAWGPWITMFLVPTLLTGLSVSPKTKQAHTVVEKAWNGLKTVLQYLSIATFKDQPGTFQLPLKMGALVKKAAKNPDPPGGPGACAALIIAVSLGSLMNLSACHWWQGETGQQVKQGMIDCGKQAVMTNAGASGLRLSHPAPGSIRRRRAP